MRIINIARQYGAGVLEAMLLAAGASNIETYQANLSSMADAAEAAAFVTNLLSTIDPAGETYVNVYLDDWDRTPADVQEAVANYIQTTFGTRNYMVVVLLSLPKFEGNIINTPNP